MPVLDSVIAQHAKDEIPETWKALASNNSGADFGEEALARRLDRVIRKTFGTTIATDTQKNLDIRVIEYVSKLLVLDLIRPGVDFWSKQALSMTAGERESKAYANRAEELKKMRSELLEEVAELLIDIQPLLPTTVKRVRDAPRVSEIGANIPHLTSSPYDLDPLFGPKEDIASRDS